MQLPMSQKRIMSAVGATVIFRFWTTVYLFKYTRKMMMSKLSVFYENLQTSFSSSYFLITVFEYYTHEYCTVNEE